MSESILKLNQSAPQGVPTAQDLTLEGRQTEELVFAFVGPVGSGVSYTADLMLKKMVETFGYSGCVKKISDVIAEDAPKVEQDNSYKSGLERIEGLQKTGNLLRSRFGVDYLARRIIEKINEERALALTRMRTLLG